METRYPWYEHGWSPSYAILDSDDFKFIKAPHPELYNLGTDPKELNNIIGGSRGRAGKMAETMNEIREEFAASSIATDGLHELDHETRDRLSSLGYVLTGGTDREIPPDAPDVKDMTEVMKMLSRASETSARSTRFPPKKRECYSPCSNEE